MPINAQIEHFDEEGLKELFEAALEKVTFIDHDYQGILRDKTMDENVSTSLNKITHLMK